MANRFFLFTSDKTARYRLDAVKALALPAGAIIQFRYQDEHLTPAVRDVLHRRRTAETNEEYSALICFVDFQHPRVTAYPCREAVLVGADRVGSAWVLQLRVQRYVSAKDPSTVLPAVASGSEELRALKQRNESRSPEAKTDEESLSPPMFKPNTTNRGGKFFLRSDVPDDHFEFGLTTSTDLNTALGVWEKCVRQLQELPTFKEDVFYGFVEDGPRDQESFALEVQPGKELAITLCHFATKEQVDSKLTSELVIATGGDRLYEANTATRRIDSRYDLHRFNLRGRHDLGVTHTFARVCWHRRDQTDVLLEDAFDIPIAVKRTLWPMLAVPAAIVGPLGAALGLFFSAKLPPLALAGMIAGFVVAAVLGLLAQIRP